MEGRQEPLARVAVLICHLDSNLTSHEHLRSSSYLPSCDIKFNELRWGNVGNTEQEKSLEYKGSLNN